MPRRTTNVALEETLLAEAEALKIDVSLAAEAGLIAAVEAARRKQWQTDNRDAIQSYNDWINKRGLPLEKWRPF